MIIYLLNVEGTNLYKIGITKNKVSKRLLNLQTGNPHIIHEIWNYESVLASRVERSIHRHYKYAKSHGEWFLFDNISIEDVKDKIKNIDKILKDIENTKEESSD